MDLTWIYTNWAGVNVQFENTPGLAVRTQNAQSWTTYNHNLPAQDKCSTEKVTTNSLS